jgi:hypothetical protein
MQRDKFDPHSYMVKIRLVLTDRGTRLMDIETPRQLSMGIYDLLESECLPLPLWLSDRLGIRVTRNLFSQSKILHHDISP